MTCVGLDGKHGNATCLMVAPLFARTRPCGSANTPCSLGGLWLGPSGRGVLMSSDCCELETSDDQPVSVRRGALFVDGYLCSRGKRHGPLSGTARRLELTANGIIGKPVFQPSKCDSNAPHEYISKALPCHATESGVSSKRLAPRAGLVHLVPNPPICIMSCVLQSAPASVPLR